MERVFYTPERFTRRGEKFETPNCLGGTFTIEFVRKTATGRYMFLRRRMADWPEESYNFTADELKQKVYVLVPDKFQRLVLSNEATGRYEAILNDPLVDRTERF